MTNYQKQKKKARQTAITWQFRAGVKKYSFAELVNYMKHFQKLGKRYGLLKEFRENGII